MFLLEVWVFLPEVWVLAGSSVASCSTPTAGLSHLGGGYSFDERLCDRNEPFASAICILALPF